MAQRTSVAVPELQIDDGALFYFSITDESGNAWYCGFYYRPINTPAPQNGTVFPPITWTEYDTLYSWIETLKYAARNNKKVSVTYDDELSISHQSWEANVTGVGGGGAAWAYQQVYQVTG
jgi:hypothetical protein